MIKHLEGLMLVAHYSLQSSQKAAGKAYWKGLWLCRNRSYNYNVFLSTQVFVGLNLCYDRKIV